jgi:mRNA-degrading endonuclease YafQ of YafQ-DinJ toxin-antitoxin module
MRVIHRTSQFKKDVKRMNKRGKSFSMFKEVVGKLVHLGINEALVAYLRKT